MIYCRCTFLSDELFTNKIDDSSMIVNLFTENTKVNLNNDFNQMAIEVIENQIQVVH